MNPLNSKLPVIFLKPGEVYVSDQPVIVTTTLGSCVAVVFFHPHYRLGAICHAVLPSGNGRKNKFKYLDNAFFWMLERFKSLGIPMEEVHIKLFGGADVLEYHRGDLRPVTIGQQNSKKILELVETEGLKIKASNLGGPMGLKIFFYTHTGEVLVKKIEKVCWIGQKR
jgi:chemotaxis protein CheD